MSIARNLIEKFNLNEAIQAKYGKYIEIEGIEQSLEDGSDYRYLVKYIRLDSFKDSEGNLDFKKLEKEFDKIDFYIDTYYKSIGEFWYSDKGKSSKIKKNDMITWKECFITGLKGKEWEEFHQWVEKTYRPVKG